MKMTTTNEMARDKKSNGNDDDDENEISFLAACKIIIITVD